MNSPILISRISIPLLICMLAFTVSAQSNNTFFLGHSLVNFDIPNMVDKLSIAGSNDFSYDANIGIGATLGWHWSHPETGQGSQWDLTLPQGGYENFILTEAVPLENHLQFSNTYRIVDSLCSFANQYNPDVQCYIYETWHCTNSGNGSTSGSGGYPCDWDPNSNTPWRERLNIDLPKWESIADSISAIHETDMLLIPGGQALGRLADSIEIGVVPGLTSVFDVFTDDYHLDSRGNYFIACVMYSVIHHESPVGLPNQLTGPFGNLYQEYPTIDQATVMQEIAWQTVCDYGKNGVDCEAVIKSNDIAKNFSFSIYPQPASDFIKIEDNLFSETTPYNIYNQLGEIVQSGKLVSKTSMIDISLLTSGIYFLTTRDRSLRFLK